MGNGWDENKPQQESTASEGATPAGMVEAVTQDVELIVDKVIDTAEEAVVAIQKRLGIARAARTKKAAGPKPKPRAVKMKARAIKARPRKALTVAARKVTKPSKPKRIAKPGKTKRKR